jgi:hypothetical protein
MIDGIFHFRGEDAKKFGVIPAVLLYNLRFWVKKNQDNERNFHDGHYWTFNTLKAFTRQFPFLSKGQIERGLEALEKKEVIKTGNFDKARRTKWYTVMDMVAPPPSLEAEQEKEEHFPDPGNAFPESKKCISRNQEMPPYTDINTHIETTYTPPDPEVIPKEVFEVTSFWNKTGILTKGHTLTPKNVTKIEKALNLRKKDFALDDIYQAIDNYKAALDSGRFTYKWDLWEFLSRPNAEKFFGDNFKPENYEKEKKAPTARQSNQDLAKKLGL